MLVNVTVAADRSCSRADGGSMILSPLRTGVEVAGRMSNWLDHFRGRSVESFMADRVYRYYKELP